MANVEREQELEGESGDRRPEGAERSPEESGELGAWGVGRRKSVPQRAHSQIRKRLDGPSAEGVADAVSLFSLVRSRTKI